MQAQSIAAGSVCLVVPGSLDTETGGYVYDRRVLAELASLGWQVSVVSLDPSFPEPTGAALEAARRQLEAIAAGTSVVIDGLALAGLLPLLPALVTRVRAAALIHHPLADETGLDAARAAALAAAEATALALMPRVIVTSRWTRRRLADYGIDPARVIVVEPGVDSDRIAPPARRAGWAPAGQHAERGAAASRRESGPPGELPPTRLLSVATITERKGHAVLIDALAELEDLTWTLRCVGSLERDPACVSALRHRIDAFGLTDRVRLLGELPSAALCDEYAAADLFVLPSYLEGYGMSLSEAIASGLPVVSTTAGAIPDTVPADAARLVEPGDVAALSAALRSLMSERARLDELAMAARRAGAQTQSWTSSARRFAGALMQDSSP
jgi:glycosyltransferase involved in cell wall biosynthesis